MHRTRNWYRHHAKIKLCKTLALEIIRSWAIRQGWFGDWGPPPPTSGFTQDQWTNYLEISSTLSQAPISIKQLQPTHNLSPDRPWSTLPCIPSPPWPDSQEEKKDDKYWSYPGTMRGRLLPLKQELKNIWPLSKEFTITFTKGNLFKWNKARGSVKWSRDL